MISVIVPVYNIKDYISRCVDSILAQTYPDWELILVDDGSTDGSGEIIDAYAKADARIKALHKENGGVSSARNLGLSHARGEYISIIDGDDWIEPALFQDAVDSLTGQDADVFMFEYYVDKNGVSQKHAVDPAAYGVISVEDCLIRSITPDNRFAWSKVFASKLLAGRGPSDPIRFNTDIILGEDTLFIIEVISNARSCVYTEQAYYHYDQREGSAVRSGFNERKLSGLEAYKRILELFRNGRYDRVYDHGCAALMNLGVQLGCRMLESGAASRERLSVIRDSIGPVRSTVLRAKCVDRETKLKALLSGISLQGTCRALLRRRNSK
jgi:glycosyltransferase involved in cell wall biosynthesis